MIPYLSCDWGTSSFRLSLADAESFTITESAGTNKGILSTFNSWNKTANADPINRLSFYLNIISEQIVVIEKKLHSSLDNIPLLISGMASSSIGMKPLPYHELPFYIDGSALLSDFIPQSQEFKHDILLISGVKSDDDVMRGEETQLIGLFSINPAPEGEKLYILPGTHSKHIVVNEDRAVAFKTFMTGEFFDLLSNKSILHAGLEEGGDLHDRDAKESFEKGVMAGSCSNLLNSSFKVRTNSLFNLVTGKDNYFYLSGLLIGAELGEIAHNDTIEIYLCCGAKLKSGYETAIHLLGLKNKIFSFDAETVERAAIVGQYKIYEKYSKR